MKEENSFLLVTTLIIVIVASIFCASEWFNGNQEYALVLTAGSAIALPFYAVTMVLRQIRKNETILFYNTLFAQRNPLITSAISAKNFSSSTVKGEAI